MKKLFTILVLFTMILSMTAQTEKFYEWKNGTYTEREVIDIDSITFTLPFVSKEDNDIKPSIPEYAIDLGLPSRTLWADRNVGADSPEAYGDYFAWGETEPKINYSWNNYKWCEGTDNTISKYCTDLSYGYNGFTDKKYILDSEDDASFVNMGKEWRMPTKAEYEELLSKCTWDWTELNSVIGYKVTGPNGNSIFFPAAGSNNDSEASIYGKIGLYYSSSLCESAPYGAWYLIFYNSFERACTMLHQNRCNGYTVRAVVR